MVNGRWWVNGLDATVSGVAGMYSCKEGSGMKRWQLSGYQFLHWTPPRGVLHVLDAYRMRVLVLMAVAPIINR